MSSAPRAVSDRESPIAHPYASGFAHLADELRRLDLRLAARIAARRGRRKATDGLTAHRHLVIAHEEADALLDEADEPDAPTPELALLERRLAGWGRAIDARVAATLAAGGALPLPQLGATFGLSPFELGAVVICLAPELDRKYDRLYAYVQDDITRQRPSVDLALDLLCPTQAARWEARPLLSPHGALLRAGLIETVDDQQSPSGSSDLARSLRLDRRILDYLLGHNAVGPALAEVAILHEPDTPLAAVPVASELKDELARLLDRTFAPGASERRRMVLHLHGPRGVGRRSLARGLCADLGCPFLEVDLEAAAAHPAGLAGIVRLALREGLLLQAAVYLDGAAALLRDDDGSRAALAALARGLGELGWLVFLGGEGPWPRPDRFAGAIFRDVALPLPTLALRERSWRRALGQTERPARPDGIAELADRFRLTPAQIRAAAADAAQRSERALPTLDDLADACRRQAGHRLGELARLTPPRRRWGDLILPDAARAQLRELCGQVRHGRCVLDDWGYAARLERGLGVSALFTGPPGTGKTLAAAVVAGELRLDLYRVDLAGVVSKYIGETEKNLSRVFAEAERSNAVLFFDEADALFGKRTEVADAHDRYANIETSYLLQRMEEYEGIVILATNLRENLDEAFTRRLRFIVEFPFPDAASRARIWRGHVPDAAPLREPLDHEWLARALPVSGGNIRNIALAAAFLAAEEGSALDTGHLLRAARREFEKIGKLWVEPPAPTRE